MDINYYSTTGGCDWRLTVWSKGFSFLEIVGSEYIEGTFKYMKKHLEGID